MPQVITYDEPTASGWYMVSDKVYARAPAGTKVVTEYQDSTLLSIAGINLFGSITIDDVHARVVGKGKTVYYLSLWRLPQGFAFVGWDTYRVITVRNP